MAVMLYGIVSTTRAKQIAQTGIVSEGLTTISPVTLKFGSNEVNYFFFNRKYAEEIEQRTKRRAEASNGRKRVRIIRVTFDRKALPCQADLTAPCIDADQLLGVFLYSPVVFHPYLLSARSCEDREGQKQFPGYFRRTCYAAAKQHILVFSFSFHAECPT